MTKQRPTPATITSPGSAIRFPVVVNISGYFSDFAPLKRRALRKAEEHAARQFIEYEMKDVNTQNSMAVALDRSDSRSGNRHHRLPSRNFL
jgi:hypothetical protein